MNIKSKIDRTSKNLSIRQTQKPNSKNVVMKHGTASYNYGLVSQSDNYPLSSIITTSIITFLAVSDRFGGVNWHYSFKFIFVFNISRLIVDGSS